MHFRHLYCSCKFILVKNILYITFVGKVMER